MPITTDCILAHKCTYMGDMWYIVFMYMYRRIYLIKPHVSFFFFWFHDLMVDLTVTTKPSPDTRSFSTEGSISFRCCAHNSPTRPSARFVDFVGWGLSFWTRPWSMLRMASRTTRSSEPSWLCWNLLFGMDKSWITGKSYRNLTCNLQVVHLTLGSWIGGLVIFQ